MRQFWTGLDLIWLTGTISLTKYQGNSQVRVLSKNYYSFPFEGSLTNHRPGLKAHDGMVGEDVKQNKDHSRDH